MLEISCHGSNVAEPKVNKTGKNLKGVFTSLEIEKKHFETILSFIIFLDLKITTGPFPGLQIFKNLFSRLISQPNKGTKISKYCNCPAGRVTYNFHSSCKHMHLSFKSVCNKEHKGAICNMLSLSNFKKNATPTGRVLCEELV